MAREIQTPKDDRRPTDRRPAPQRLRNPGTRTPAPPGGLPGSGHPPDPSAAYEAVRILSGKWVFAVLVQLARGPHYHNELARSTGMPENKPLDRVLDRLLHMRLVDRTVHNLAGSAPRVRYQLTPRGHSVLPIIDELAGWWQATELPEH
ncbi:helix-turn-helix domain-containing protein [Kitasatospora sp. NPDC002551]|uniref:winged helix-turn-helix transcriptional regulator n=1 Tax=unclassified Kitasatospora TaxID=2633591 RepID=UPI0033270DA3